MDVEIRLGCFEDAAVVRRAVFMDEQGYEDEFEPLDDAPGCIHVTAYVDGELVGCGRTFSEELELAFTPGKPHSPACALDEGVSSSEAFIMGRVAVLAAWRRRGLASKIALACEDAAREAGARLMKLHAQEYVRGLYVALGYEQISPVDYEDEGQPHLWMAKLL